MEFDLEALSWREFELLVGSYLKRVLGESSWLFDGSSDQGRDAKFSGTANAFPSEAAPYSGDFIVQVKHRTTKNATISQNERGLIKSLGSELEKIFLKYQHRCDHYIYVTNIQVTNSYKEDVAKEFQKFCTAHGISDVSIDTLDYADFAAYLRESSQVRRSFPALLQFSDIEQIFRRKEEIKNNGYLKSALQGIRRFVSTGHYREAIQRISQYNILMLVGDPKSGKTSIVEAIAVSFLEGMAHKPYFIKNTDEFFNIVSTLADDEKALFICDDIFGIHELDPIKLSDWADYFQAVFGNINENYKFVFTTREYIYREFERKSGLKGLFPSDQDPERFVVKLKELGREEREQILEKHLYTADLNTGVIDEVLRLKETVLQSKDFSPEIIRSLITLLSGQSASAVADIVSAHISQPNQYLFDFFSNINEAKRILLLGLAVSQGNQDAIVESTYRSLLVDSGTQDTLVFGTFVNELDGSIIKTREYSNYREIDYYHPSMYDVIVGGIAKQDKRYRSLMLRNTNLELLNLVTLKDVLKKDSVRIQILGDEFDELKEGTERLIKALSSLADVIRLVKWANNFTNSEISYKPTFIQRMNQLQGNLKSHLGSEDFFVCHEQANLVHWIDLLDIWSTLKGAGRLLYAPDLARKNTDIRTYDYWRLMFLIEHVNPNFIDENVDPQVFTQFSERFAVRVRDLAARLNMRRNKQGEMRPYTEEGWLPLYVEIRDLVRIMKKTQLGRQILEKNFRDEWATAEKWSQTAANRHRGMVQHHGWHTFKRLRNFDLIWQIESQ